MRKGPLNNLENALCTISFRTASKSLLGRAIILHNKYMYIKLLCPFLSHMSLSRSYKWIAKLYANLCISICDQWSCKQRTCENSTLDSNVETFEAHTNTNSTNLSQGTPSGYTDLKILEHVVFAFLICGLCIYHIAMMGSIKYSSSRIADFNKLSSSARMSAPPLIQYSSNLVNTSGLVTFVLLIKKVKNNSTSCALKFWDIECKKIVIMEFIISSDDISFPW